MNDDAGTRDCRVAGLHGPRATQRRKVDARADLYACGVVLYELLTGEKPAGTDLPSDLNPSVPKQLDDVFRRSYARLEKRFTSADEFAAALPWEAGDGIAGSSPPICPAKTESKPG
jgi:serine/threonine protein kinase